MSLTCVVVFIVPLCVSGSMHGFCETEKLCMCLLCDSVSTQAPRERVPRYSVCVTSIYRDVLNLYIAQRNLGISTVVLEHTVYTCVSLSMREKVEMGSWQMSL